MAISKKSKKPEEVPEVKEEVEDSEVENESGEEESEEETTDEPQNENLSEEDKTKKEYEAWATSGKKMNCIMCEEDVTCSQDTLDAHMKTHKTDPEKYYTACVIGTFGDMIKKILANSKAKAAQAQAAKKAKQS